MPKLFSYIHKRYAPAGRPLVSLEDPGHSGPAASGFQSGLTSGATFTFTFPQHAQPSVLLKDLLVLDMLGFPLNITYLLVATNKDINGYELFS